MKSVTLRSQICMSPIHSSLIKHPSFFFSKSPSLSLRNSIPTTKITKSLPRNNLVDKPKSQDSENVKLKLTPTSKNSYSSRYVMVGAVSVGLVMLLMGFDDHQKALAFGPEGPLVEEFWDNMRRYGLYVLTVSTGVLYAIFQPIYELLKNPISAILILTILGGGFYIVSQVVYAMVGMTDFSYDYNY